MTDATNCSWPQKPCQNLPIATNVSLDNWDSDDLIDVMGVIEEIAFTITNCPHKSSSKGRMTAD